LGFSERAITPAIAQDFLKKLIEASASSHGVSLLGGVPAHWRSGTEDASDDAGWAEVWPLLKVLSPWTVGRYSDDESADVYAVKQLKPDLAAARGMNLDYMPVVFPGFTWANLSEARGVLGKPALNQIPRRCGRFYWRQIHNAVTAGATMIYGAMFDEVDEGTAMFKILADKVHAPASFVTLDADGCGLPSDWYLRLAREATKSLRAPGRIGPVLPLRIPGN
jgi:hypothetical protein